LSGQVGMQGPTGVSVLLLGSKIHSHHLKIAFGPNWLTRTYWSQRPVRYAWCKWCEWTIWHAWCVWGKWTVWSNWNARPNRSKWSTVEGKIGTYLLITALRPSRLARADWSQRTTRFYGPFWPYWPFWPCRSSWSHWGSRSFRSDWFGWRYRTTGAKRVTGHRILLLRLLCADGNG
jgi:hypothetical protein